ncbi:MAG: hypothetical protein ACMUIS_01350 [bacterium]
MFFITKDHSARIQSCIFFLSLVIIIVVGACQGAEAYYGLGLYGGGIYGGSSLYGLGGSYGLSGYGSLYGLGSLYGMGSLYGLGGLYGLSGMGGLYGMGSLYGLGGLYGLSGMTGLYGLGSLYGLGGLYGGLGGIYGLGGLSGLGGGLTMLGLAYGLGGSSGLQNLQAMAGLANPLNPFGSLGLSNLGVQSPALTNLLGITAEQAGTWTGTWYSLVKLNAGIMNMTLVEDAVNGILTGEVTLILNKFTNSVPAEVSGLYSGGDTFILTGGNNTIFSTTLLVTTAITLYEIELNCTLTGPSTMTGTYTINDLTKLLGYDYGNFNLTLSAAPII